MSDMMTTTSSSSTRRVTPEATWVTVSDDRGRLHLEQRWAVPGREARRATAAALGVPDLHQAA
jgi:hypothetical protein